MKKNQMGRLMAITLTLCLFLVGMASNALAVDKRFYLGAGYGVSDMDTGVSGLTGTAGLDEEDSGFKILGGFKFNDYFGLELAYVDMGTAELTGNNGDTFTLNGVGYTFTANNAKLEVDVTTISLGAICFLPLEKVSGQDYLKYFTPFAKLGGHFWDAEATATAAGVSATSADDDGFDLFFGLGININIIENLSVRAEWERFDTDDDLDYFSGSIIFNF